jgi:hypothetical protein
MCIGGSGSAEALPRPTAEEIMLNNLSMKKSSILVTKYAKHYEGDKAALG